jgi:hypothetical protein
LNRHLINPTPALPLPLKERAIVMFLPMKEKEMLVFLLLQGGG